jgi:hypothetical protein
MSEMSATARSRRFAGRGPALLLLLLAACADGDEDAGGSSIRFVDRAEEAGITFRMAFIPGEQGEKFKINLYDHGAGVAAGDIDGDGDDDLYFLNQLGANGLYRNNGDGTFTDVTAAAGPVALADRICSAAAFNDIDNDGDQDLFVASTRGGNALFRNDGKGVFVDVTSEAGVTWVGHSQGVTFFDAEGDGDLDLLVTNTAQWTTNRFNPRERYYEGIPTLWELVASPIEHNVFYRNLGDGRFVDATKEAGLKGVGWGGDVAAFDYDEDGDLDLFVTNMFGASLLHENDGKGRFRDVTRTTLGRTPWGTVGARAFDYDGDGHLDLYVVDMHSEMWPPPEYDPKKIEEKRKYDGPFGGLAGEPGAERWREKQFARQLGIRYEEVFFGNGLYRNLGGGKFEEVSDEAGAETYWPWGIGAGDFDNDGFVDIFLPSGMGFPYFYWRSYLLMNNGAGKFTDQARAAGIDPPPGGIVLGKIAGRDAVRSSRSVAVIDVDADGRLDLAVSNFNDRAYLFVNQAPKRTYVAFRLEGTRSNRDAIGAVVRVFLGDRVLVRQVQAAGGYLAQSSKTVHFGLGGATSVDRCEIRWPTGKVQVIDTPKVNRVHAIREPVK